MFYRIARIICRAILLLLRRWDVRGVDNMPRDGGVIVVSNHISYWDPVIVGCAFNRKINFMAKLDLFKVPLVNIIIKNLGAFPVKRKGTDTGAIRHSLKLLARGEVLGIFPEGTRSTSQELMEFHMGGAMLAVKGNAPVLPVAIEGSPGLLGKVRVSIGEPLSYSSQENQQETQKARIKKLSEQVMQELTCLKKGISK
ncbi:MAG: 1-acyl-sn-glycerol-3-phosphate acyltransferase [Clostridiales bacterium]|nr:1-acyl-sn-glycerol-3-phosphate acyltransferase [Clostridiales bacterium]MCF8023227.1 1-acyl-sn-glycerol-3-phosphate acyltransferase [Clostridiales bacterium]